MFRLTKLKLASFLPDTWLEVEEASGDAPGIAFSIHIPRGTGIFRLTVVLPKSSIRVLVQFLQQFIDDPNFIVH